MSKLTSYEADIRPLFSQRDIQAMSKAFNLASYDDAKAHAAAIFDRIRGIGGAVMPRRPPRGEGPWPQSRIDLFGKWMADGFQPQAVWSELRRATRRAGAPAECSSQRSTHERLRAGFSIVNKCSPLTSTKA
jgi:hypothetical protein